MNDAAARPDPNARRRRDARVRLIAAPLILLAVLGLLWLHDATDVAIGTHLLLAVLGVAAGAEMAILIRNAGKPARPLEAAIACGVLCLVGWIADLLVIGVPFLSVHALLLAVVILYLLLAHLRDTRPEALESIAYRLLPILYVGFLLSFMGYWTGNARLTAYLVLVAKASDMAGWLIGVPFGRHKMIPSVSPGKSWEGTIAGLAASVLVAVFLAGPLGLFRSELTWLHLALFGLLIGVASIVAGITWSGWKRRLGAKDSSALLPEMGGVLDMVDSLLLVGPAVLAWAFAVI